MNQLAETRHYFRPPASAAVLPPAAPQSGRSPLRISKLQVFHPAVGVSLKKSVLQPGESTRLRVTVVKKNIGKKRRHLRLLMITNDPMQSKVEINIKAK